MLKTVFRYIGNTFKFGLIWKHVESDNKSTELTPDEKKNQTMLIIGLIFTGVIVFFMYKWFIDPLGLIFGVSKGWRIGIAIFAFLAGFGFWSTMQNTIGFFEKANRKLSRESANSSNLNFSPEDKLMKLKKLRDTGSITEKEYITKKKELLDKI